MTTAGPTRERDGARRRLVVLALTLAAALLVGGALVPTAAAAPTANCTVENVETYPDPGDTAELNSSGSSGDYVAFDVDGDGNIDTGSYPPGYVYEATYNETGTYEPAVVAVEDTAGGLESERDQCGVIEVENNTAPSVAFDITPNPAKVNETVTFTANASDDDGYIAFYEWRVDDEVVGESDVITETFEFAGIYGIELTVTDNDDATATDIESLTVRRNQPPEAALTANRTTVDDGDAVRFNASNSTDDDGSVVLYEWDFDGDGVEDRTTEVPVVSHTYRTTPGVEWNASVTVVDDNDASDTANLTLGRVNQPPVVDIGYGPRPPLVGENVSFTAETADTDGSIASYEWRIDGEVVSTAAAFEYVFESGGARNVVVIVTDDDAATGRDNETVVVDDSNEPPVARATPNRTIVPAGGSDGVAFDASGSSEPDDRIASYEWDFGVDGSVDATGVQATGSFPPADQRRTVPVRLRVTDTRGATDTVQFLITVAAGGNKPPVAAFSSSPSLPLPDEDVTLIAAASSDPDGTIGRYAWDLDGDGSAEEGGRAVTIDVSRITANVTLTVTDDDGATGVASRAVETRSNVINATGTISIAGGGVVYLNGPPNASFTASLPNADAGDEVRFTSTSFDPDGNVTDWAWYVNGSSVSDGKSCEGRTGTCIPTSDPRPEDVSVEFDGSGTYNVTLVVTDDADASDRATRQFTVGEEGTDDPTAEFTVGRFLVPNPTTGPVLLGGAANGTETGAETQATGLFTIEAGEDTLFDASASTAVGDRSIETHLWTLDQKNGTEFRNLYGETVTDAFPAEGEYEVTLEVTDSTGETDQATQNVTVAERNETPEITDVTPDRKGAPLEGVSLTNTYTVKIANADPIDRVEFELAGRGKIDATGNDGWSGQFDLERLDDDATLTITAYDEDGDSDRVTRRIDVVQTPTWIDALIRSGSVEVRENSPTRIVITRQFPDPPIDVQFDPGQTGIPVLDQWSRAGFNVRSGIRLVYEMQTQTARIEGDGEFGLSLGPYSSTKNVDVEGTLGVTGDEQWYVRNLRVTAVSDKCCWIEQASEGVGKDFGKVSASASVKGRLSIGHTVGLTVRLERRGGNLAVAGGQIGVGFDGSGSSLSGSGEACYDPRNWCLGTTVSAELQTADLDGDIEFETDPVTLTPGLRFDGRLRLSASVPSPIRNIPGVPNQVAGTINVGGQVGDSPVTTLSVREGAAVEPLAAGPTRRGGPGGTGTVRTLDLAPRPQSTADAPITDDRRLDGVPAVAAGNGTYTAVWARQDPDGEAGETDVYAATSTDGTAWTAPTPIADGTRAAFDADVAVAGDRRAVSWMRAPLATNDTTVADLRANTSIALAVDDGTGWAAPVTIQDGDESSPVVAAAGDRVLVAWVRDADGNVTTTADRDVRWTVYDGSPGAKRTIPNATAVDVAGGPNGFTLAYLQSDDGANGSVVRAELTDGGLAETARYPATEVREVTAAPRAIAWTSFTDNGTVLRHAPAGGPTTTAPTPAVLNPESPTLLVDAGQPVLVYAGRRPLPNASRAVFVQRHADGGWLSARPLTATEGPTDRRLGRSGAAIADAGLVAVTAAGNRTTDRPADVVATRLGLAPDLAASARSPGLADASAGDQVTVNYTVRNVGDRAVAEPTTVAVETPSGTAATRTIGGLAVGDRANGSVVVRVPDSGRLTVRADAGDGVDEADESNNAARLVTARPDLSVSAAGVTRQRRGEDLLVTADVRNRGPIPVGNATVRLRSGNETLAETRVDVPDNGRRTARLRVPIDAINRSVGGAVVVDPAGAIAESDETNNAAGVRLLAVDLGLSDAVGAGPAPGGGVAVGFVSNAGPVEATAEVTVDANGTALTYRVPVEAPGSGGGESLERVRLYHPTTNGTLDLAVAPRQGRDTESFDNAVRTRANVTGNGTAPILVTGVEAPGNGRVVVDLANPGNATAGVPLRVTAGGATVAETTVVVDGGANETVTLNASTDATELTVAAPGSTATVSSGDAAPDVNGNGLAATDPDGDGRFEDVDGNGEFTVVDVAVLLDTFDRPVVRENPALFDFDGSGGINIVDVAELLDLT